ncbi:MAG: hypothetical protein ABIA04_08630 [Pseudomonadota bacterium]
MKFLRKKEIMIILAVLTLFMFSCAKNTKREQTQGGGDDGGGLDIDGPSIPILQTTLEECMADAEALCEDDFQCVLDAATECWNPVWGDIYDYYCADPEFAELFPTFCEEGEVDQCSEEAFEMSEYFDEEAGTDLTCDMNCYCGTSEQYDAVYGEEGYSIEECVELYCEEPVDPDEPEYVLKIDLQGPITRLESFHEDTDNSEEGESHAREDAPVQSRSDDNSVIVGLKLRGYSNGHPDWNNRIQCMAIRYKIINEDGSFSEYDTIPFGSGHGSECEGGTAVENEANYETGVDQSNSSQKALTGIYLQAGDSDINGEIIRAPFFESREREGERWLDRDNYDVDVSWIHAEHANDPDIDFLIWRDIRDCEEVDCVITGIYFQGYLDGEHSSIGINAEFHDVLTQEVLVEEECLEGEEGCEEEQAEF